MPSLHLFPGVHICCRFLSRRFLPNFSFFNRALIKLSIGEETWDGCKDISPKVRWRELCPHC